MFVVNFAVKLNIVSCLFERFILELFKGEITIDDYRTKSQYVDQLTIKSGTMSSGVSSTILRLYFFFVAYQMKI